MESTQVGVKRLLPNATLPTRATQNSAGLDLASAYDNVIAAKSKTIIRTDLPRVEATIEMAKQLLDMGIGPGDIVPDPNYDDWDISIPQQSLDQFWVEFFNHIREWCDVVPHSNFFKITHIFQNYFQNYLVIFHNL